MNVEETTLLVKYLSRLRPHDYKALYNQFDLTGKKGLRKLTAEKSLEYFCKTYLADQFDKEFSDYQNEVLNFLVESIDNNTKDRKMVIAPRGHGKSTLSSLVIPLFSALYQKKTFIVFISASQDMANMFLAKIKAIIENPIIISDFGELKGNVWNSEEIELKNGVTIITKGITSTLRGLNKKKRPDLVILDDIETTDSANSATLKNKIEKAFREDILSLGDSNTSYFFVGTLITQDSLLSKIYNDTIWQKLFYSAILSFAKNQNLWNKWFEIITDKKNINCIQYAYNYYTENKEAMLEGTKVLWEDKYKNDCYYNLMLDRLSIGESAFWSEMMNQPSNSEDRIFKNLRYYSNDEFPENITLKIAVDPSEGNTKTKNGDSTAIVIGGYANNCYWIKEGSLIKAEPSKLIEIIVQKIELYNNIDEIIIESNLFRGMLEKQLLEALQKKKLYRRIKGIRNTKNKKSRIIQLEPLINAGSILFSKGNFEFNKEIEDYSDSCKHDDAPDCLQMLIENLKKNTTKIIKKPKGW